MTLDKNKKYEFAGDVYSWEESIWHSKGRGWLGCDFQWLANKGLVKEVREPIVGRGRLVFDEDGTDTDRRFFRVVIGLSKDQARGRTFDIVATEVVE